MVRFVLLIRSRHRLLLWDCSIEMSASGVSFKSNKYLDPIWKNYHESFASNAMCVLWAEMSCLSLPAVSESIEQHRNSFRLRGHEERGPDTFSEADQNLRFARNRKKLSNKDNNSNFYISAPRYCMARGSSRRG
jgi:hypothetical protein